MNAIPIKTDLVPEFCRRWKVRQFALIGSVLRPDFGQESDVDVVLTFEPDAAWSMFDIVGMRDELVDMFGRAVDIIEEPAVRNPYMLASIRRTKRVLYAA
ncbi:MAG: nucleotidyltransferase domain-containing protein [Phycisphaeraceae bacterium]|nr:nucleotidyltransferase domain-containing protein [Phycisphaeraceae bacterium]